MTECNKEPTEAVTGSLIHNVNNRLFRRYRSIVRESSQLNDDQKRHIIGLCETAMMSPHMYVDKHSRWLGYIQGYLTAYGLLSVLEERNLSRPLYHEAYRHMGLPEPPSLSVAPLGK